MASANKAGVLRKQAKRYEVVANRTIALACEKFLRSRGIQAGTREKFNSWHRTEEPKTDGLPLS